jgi:hypothetical protein
MPKMIPVATSEEVNIHSPYDGRYAFYNSPYPAHKLSTGLDIFPQLDFGEKAPSPVDGEVVMIKRVKAPKGKRFLASKYDVVMVIRSEENRERIVKILHVDPVVDVGQGIKAGEDLGLLLRSGYYGFGTGAHMHIEVRNPSDPIRARGGYPLERILQVEESPDLNHLKGRVTMSKMERTFIKLEGMNRNGLQGRSGGINLLLDGGIPVYGWLGAHYEDRPGSKFIELAGEPIAEIISLDERSCIARCLDFSITLNEIPVGLFLYLYSSNYPEIMISGRKPGDLGLEEGEEVNLRIIHHS